MTANDTKFELWLCLPTGERLALLERAAGFSYARRVNALGWFDITLPGDYDKTLLRPDSIIEIWRKPQGARRYRDFSGFLLLRHFETSADGVDSITISGPDCNDLVARRIVAYAAASAYTSKTDQADDMLNALARENLGALATDASRDLTAKGFTVWADIAAGPSLTKRFAWDDLLGVMAGIANTSATAGTDLYWLVEPAGVGQFAFSTYTGQPGSDRTVGSENPVVFGLEWGNLEKPSLDEDYTGEANYIYAGGQGEEADRMIVEITDAARVGRSPFGRREAFIDARNEPTTAGVTAVANERLEEGRPRLRFSGDLLSTPQTAYGVDWYFGDRVTVTYQKIQFDVLIDAISVAVDGTGQESITAHCKIDEPLIQGAAAA